MQRLRLTPSAAILLATIFAGGSTVTSGQPVPSFPGMPQFQSVPTADAAIKTQLVPIPSLPPGVAMTYTPMAESGYTAIDPAQSLREAQQRAQELTADLLTIGRIDNLPSVGSPEFARLRTDAHAILQRRFLESRSALESDATATFKTNVTWTPDFSAAPRAVAPADTERARAASYSVAYAITHLDRPRFILAYAAAVFALDPESSLGAENAASAILSSGERLHPNQEDAAQLKPFRDDAAVVYRYALARSVVNSKWTLRSLGILINLGNLYVDLNAPDRARPVLLAAKMFAPDSWDAALALASCYERQGRSDLARAALEDPRLAAPSVYATTAKGAKNLRETVEATELTPDSSEAEFEAVMEKLDKQEILTAADFVGQLNQSERNRMRYFLNNLPVEGSYRAPEIDGVTQFATVRAINQPGGIEALSDFAERVGSYSLLLYGRMMEQQQHALARLGLGLQLNVDINDVMANPHKYRNHKIEGKVTGVDQLKSRVEQMKQQALQAHREIATGNISTLLQMGAESDPMLAVFTLKAVDFANPMDVLIQQYNASLIGRKMNMYNAYFFAVNDRTQASLNEIATLHAQKINSINEQEVAEMNIFQQQRSAAHKAGQDTNSAQWRIREHNIHQKFSPQYNDATDFAWKQATQVASIAYERKIKRRAERFYYDVFRHIALISDPAVRERKNRDFQHMLHFGVQQGLTHVLAAFGGYEYREDWDCRCDVGGLAEQAKSEQAELDRLAEARRARDNEAKLAFKAGKIPESSQLFQRIDAYGTDLNIPGIPLLSGRISCARTTLSLGADFPGAYSPKVNYTFTENAFTGATTHGGGVEVGVKVRTDPMTASATLNVKGAISLDGKGKVTDYSVTGGSRVKFDVGPTSLTAGAEIGYTPTGGLTSDVNAGASVSFSTPLGTDVELSIEASARRGSTLSAKAEKNFNPNSDQYDEVINETLGPISDIYPVDSSIKKEIWSGSYTL